MVVEKKLSWTKKGVFKGLKGGTERNCSELAIKAVEGADASIVVSMCAVGDAKISVTMNGEEVLAEVVLFSVEKDDMAESEVN